MKEVGLLPPYLYRNLLIEFPLALGIVCLCDKGIPQALAQCSAGEKPAILMRLWFLPPDKL